MMAMKTTVMVMINNISTKERQKPNKFRFCKYLPATLPGRAVLINFLLFFLSHEGFLAIAICHLGRRKKERCGGGGGCHATRGDE